MSMETELDALINGEIASHDLTGSTLYLLRPDGEVVFRKSYGVLDPDSRAPMPENPIVRLYSMSKPITSCAAMILLERGVIALDEPVSKYLDGFKDQTVWQDCREVPAEQPITIRDLLNMTSGLTYPDAATEPGRRMTALFEKAIDRALAGNGWSTVEFCNLIGQQPLVFQPGTRWQYGTSADVLGAVIEVASGMPFGDFLRREIFRPLDMADTDFYVPAEKWNRFHTMCQYRDTEPKLTPYPGNHLVILNFRNKPVFESGGAGLASTPDDYARFARMLMSGGELDGVRILKPETVEFMYTTILPEKLQPYFDWEQLTGYSYSNLMRILIDPAKVHPTMCNVGVRGEYGWDGWAGTYFAADPHTDLITLYFISRIDYSPNEMRGKMREIIYKYLSK